MIAEHQETAGGGAPERQQDRLLSLLGHELRNSINSMNLAVELIERRCADPAVDRPRALLKRQLQHMTRLVEDLLDVSRLRLGKIQLEARRLDLAALVREVLEARRGCVEAAGLTLARELPAAPVWLRGDPARLTQVVTHLLQNAIQFTDPGGEVGVQVFGARCSDGSDGSDGPDGSDRAPNTEYRTPNTEYRTPNTEYQTPNTAVLTIRDTGVGIDAARLPWLFEPLAAATDDRSDHRGGIGMGLALVRGLVELHDGWVVVESAGVGRGAVVTVSLPAG